MFPSQDRHSEWRRRTHPSIKVDTEMKKESSSILMFCNCFFRLSRPQAPLQKSICNAEDNSLKKKAPGYLGSFTEFILKKVHIEFSASVYHYENCFLIYTVYSSFQHTSSIPLLLSFPWSVFGILGTFAFPVFLVCHRIGGYDSLKNA